MCDLCARRSDLPQTENRRKMIERECPCPNAPMSEHANSNTSVTALVRTCTVRPTMHEKTDTPLSQHTNTQTATSVLAHVHKTATFSSHLAHGHKDRGFSQAHVVSGETPKRALRSQTRTRVANPRERVRVWNRATTSPGTRQACVRRVKLSHKHLFLLPVVDSFMPSS